MDEIQYYRMCENAAIGEWLIKAIAKSVGVEPNVELIDRAVFKGTVYEAWVRFDEKGIQVGSIVDWSDAEFAEYIDLSGIDCDENGESLLAERFWNLVDKINDLASEAWWESYFHFCQLDDDD